VGHPGAGGSAPRDVRLVRRAVELPHGGSIARGDQALLAGERAPPREGHPPPSTGRRC
jgi:hypothetical protein